MGENVEKFPFRGKPVETAPSHPSKGEFRMTKKQKKVLYHLAINGISIYEAENEQFLTKALNYTREISLPHDKNSFNIHFCAALNLMTGPPPSIG